MLQKHKTANKTVLDENNAYNSQTLLNAGSKYSHTCDQKELLFLGSRGKAKGNVVKEGRKKERPLYAHGMMAGSSVTSLNLPTTCKPGIIISPKNGRDRGTAS